MCSGCLDLTSEGAALVVDESAVLRNLEDLCLQVAMSSDSCWTDLNDYANGTLPLNFNESIPPDTNFSCQIWNEGAQINDVNAR